MRKLTLILPLTFFSLVAVLLLSTARFQNYNQNLSQTSPVPTAQPSEEKVILQLDPSNLTLEKEKELKIKVIITSKLPVIGADLVLKFDPQVLELKNITPGKFFESPLEIQKLIEQQKGEGFYAIGSFSPQKGEDHLATFIFQIKTSSPTTTQIFLDKQTEVAVKGKKEIKTNLPISGKYKII
jgi:hypothetical protein